MSDLIQVILLYVYRNVIVLSIFKFKNYMISDYSESMFLVHQLFEVCNFFTKSNSARVVLCLL